MKLINDIELNNFSRVVLNGKHVWDRHTTDSHGKPLWINVKHYEEYKGIVPYKKFVPHDKMCKMIKYLWWSKKYRMVINGTCINLYEPTEKKMIICVIGRGTSYDKGSWEHS